MVQFQILRLVHNHIKHNYMNGDNMLLQCLIQIQHSWYFPCVKNKCWIVVFMGGQSIDSSW